MKKPDQHIASFGNQDQAVFEPGFDLSWGGPFTIHVTLWKAVRVQFK